MESSIKFSVLVPVYKVEKYIDECIQSVLNQTYGNFELILVDDGSPDRSGRICEEYAAKDSRIKVFHKENGGLMSARRYGIAKATGDYYVFLDSDDYIALNSLEILEKNIRQTGADCVIYGIEWLKPGGTEYVRCNDAYCNRLITDKAEALNIILNDSSFNSLCRKCTKASCFDGRDFSHWYHISSGEDRLQSLEILENAQSFLFIPEMLHYYRANETSITHTINYDGYKADFTVEEESLACAKKVGVLADADFDRMRNFALDALVIELKRISRFCSDKANSVAGFESICESTYYSDFLAKGYRKAPALPGVKEAWGVRRVMNKAAFSLFRAHRYDLLIFLIKHIYK